MLEVSATVNESELVVLVASVPAVATSLDDAELVKLSASELTLSSSVDDSEVVKLAASVLVVSKLVEDESVLEPPAMVARLVSLVVGSPDADDSSEVLEVSNLTDNSRLLELVAYVVMLSKVAEVGSELELPRVVSDGELDWEVSAVVRSNVSEASSILDELDVSIEAELEFSDTLEALLLVDSAVLEASYVNTSDVVLAEELGVSEGSTVVIVKNTVVSEELDTS